MGTDPAVRPAATVILLRDRPAGPETFMVRRYSASSFMANAHVFPGGRVDQADFSATAAWCDGVDAASTQLAGLESAGALAHAVAAARELFEEAGVLLARDNQVPGTHPALAGHPPGTPLAPAWHPRLSQLRGDVHARRRTFRDVVETERLRLGLDWLVPFAHWVTPPGDTRCFDTRFFVTGLPAGQTPVHDGTEAIDSVWLTPVQAIDAAIARTIVLPVPTWVTRRELQPFTRVDDALSWARTRIIERRQPGENGRRIMVVPGGRPDLPDLAPFESRFVWTGDGWRAEGLA